MLKHCSPPESRNLQLAVSHNPVREASLKEARRVKEKQHLKMTQSNKLTDKKDDLMYFIVK